ncbi:cytochrome b/b6 domain-containing protein [Polynucleobacter necessarius]|uniref:cytochrome b/b6 domain-containing protein n=1 Tax=Polynucleobacter necessarius TaxID=576610 RepID=UPI0018D57B0F|nr:cytochrome b/b6 domain-containing protein [Polynucleobacter necessarius]
MKRSFSKVLRTLVVTAGLSLTLASGISFAERAPMAPLPSPSGVDIPPLSVPVNLNALANGTQAQAQPDNPSIFTSANSDPHNYVSIPDKEASVLIQCSGQEWRVIRNGVITVYGGWLLALAFFGIIATYTLKGPMKLHEPMSDVKIKRFSAFDRLVHWFMAFSFLVLAFTGLLILYGKYFAMPLIGGTAYGSFLMVCKNIHNFTGPLFTICIVIFFLLFAYKNVFGKGDMASIMGFGGVFFRQTYSSGLL